MFTVLWKTENGDTLSRDYKELVDALDKYNKLYKTAGIIFAEVKQEGTSFLNFKKGV